MQNFVHVNSKPKWSHFEYSLQRHLELALLSSENVSRSTFSNAVAFLNTEFKTNSL